MKQQRKTLKLWLENLRSGDYAQTKKLLRDQNGFCCLGVLCDTVDPQAWQEDTSQYYYPMSDGEVDKSQIDLNTFERWTGFSPKKRHSPIDAFEPMAFLLPGLNDIQGWDFNQIADFVEQKAKEEGILD